MLVHYTFNQQVCEVKCRCTAKQCYASGSKHAVQTLAASDGETAWIGGTGTVLFELHHLRVAFAHLVSDFCFHSCSFLVQNYSGYIIPNHNSKPMNFYRLGNFTIIYTSFYNRKFLVIIAMQCTHLQLLLVNNYVLTILGELLQHMKLKIFLHTNVILHIFLLPFSSVQSLLPRQPHQSFGGSSACSIKKYPLYHL